MNLSKKTTKKTYLVFILLRLYTCNSVKVTKTAWYASEKPNRDCYHVKSETTHLDRLSANIKNFHRVHRGIDLSSIPLQHTQKQEHNFVCEGSNKHTHFQLHQKGSS